MSSATFYKRRAKYGGFCAHTGGCVAHEAHEAHEDENQGLKKMHAEDWLLRLTAWQCYWGFGWKHQPVYRIYRDLARNMRRKPKKRLVRESQRY
tara:strand:+ start:96 stop:377 length:282 start_codon:yes stop_codon:yes gene_type:complete